MVRAHWAELQDRQVQYLDASWRLTGDVDVREQGDLLAVEVRRDDDVREAAAALCFSVDDDSGSLNPGNMGEHFDRIERGSNTYYLYVKKQPRTYRYVLRRLERR